MKPISFSLSAAALTLALTAGLAGFSLTHALHRSHAGGNAALPDLPDGNGTGTRLPNGWHITPAGTPITLPGDLPLKMAFSPNGKFLLVVTGGYHDHGVSVIDRATNTVTQNVNLGKVWAGMCFGPDGKDVYVSGGGTPSTDFLAGAVQAGAKGPMLEGFEHPILRLSYADGQLVPQTPIDIEGLKPADRFTAGLVSGPDGALFAVNIQNDTVYKLIGPTHTVVASAQVGYRPYACALSPDGKTLAVSNLGGEERDTAGRRDTSCLRDRARRQSSQ